MSRRDSDSDSDSKRRHSRFDLEPSPKRYRRDEKQDRHSHRHSAFLKNGDHENRDHTSQRQLLDHSNQPSGSLHKHKHKHTHNNNNNNNKPNEASHPTQLPTSLSYFQHDEQGSAGQVGRSSGQKKAGERGWWKDAKNRQYERAETSHSREPRDEKSQAKLGDNTFQIRFSERKDDPPTSRKRPAFREKKIPADLGDAKLVVTVAVKSSQIDRSAERNERRDERSSNPHHLHRVDKQFAEDRAPNKGEARRDRFPFRGRYGGSGGNGNYRGRDKFNGRQDDTRTEKWKHDLYQEVNKDPIPQNEDDQIAKLEALLAS